MDDGDVLRDALTSITPAGVVSGLRVIQADDMQHLLPEEFGVIERAVALRQHEFASGRALLRELMGTHEAVPVAPNRAPQLPNGVIGSLAHDRRFAVAAVSRDPRLLSIGIDVEPLTSLSDDMVAAILRDDEAGIDAHLAFSLKEAAYKAWSALGGRMLDHRDVRLTVADGRFVAEVFPDGTLLHGVFAVAAGRSVALVVVDRIN